MAGDTVRMAVVGVGHWGKNHARVCWELGVLRVIADTDPERRAWARERFPGVEVVADAYEVFARPDVDGVILATPAATHYALAREALRQGKDVLVEKPLALHVKEARELVAMAARLGRVLMVGHVLEYHPAVSVLERLIQDGELGRIRYLYSNRLNWGRIRTEENILWSFAPHDVALMLRFLKQEPRHVSAFGKAYLSPEVADVTLTVLEFAGGVQGHIFVSWLHPFKEQRFVVVGEKRIAVFDDTQPWERKLVLYSHQVDWKGMVPIARKAEGEAVPLEPREPLKEEIRDFVRSIQERARPVADGTSALRVLKVLEAAQRSLDDHGQRVRLDQVEEEKPRYFVHPTAVVDEGAEIGEGTKIWHFSHVMSGARIGRQCVLGQNVFVGRNVVIGNRCKIQNNVSVYEGVILEDGVFCGPSMVFTNVINPRAEVERKDEFRKTLVRRGATLGANSTIVCGVTIGRYAFVGAGAVVTRDVPDYALVVGVPARVVGWMCACGVKLQFEGDWAVCQACGKSYRQVGDRVVPEEEV